MSETQASEPVSTEMDIALQVRNTSPKQPPIHKHVTGDQDLGRHTVCTKVTTEFLEYSKSVGNDLSTPAPQYYFPGLQDGDLWCLCAARFAQAYRAGMAPKIVLQATHEKTLDHVSLDVLMEYAVDREEAEGIISELDEKRERLNRLL